MAPLVSILIPAFNAESTLRDTLQSAVAQTWRPTEIIVVDDGSADTTASIAEEFAPRGVALVTQANSGAAAARNRALSLCRGDYIQWLDADDLLAPDKVEQQMCALADRSGGTVASGSFGRFWHRPSRARFQPTGLWCDLTPLEWLLRKMEQYAFMQTATWLVPHSVAMAAGPWDTRLVVDDDGEYFCRVLLSSDFVHFVPAARVLYRVSGSQSLSWMGHSQAKMEALLLSIRLHIGHIRSLADTKRVRLACLRYLQDSLIAFFPERPDLVAQAAQLAHELGGSLLPPRFSWKYSWLAATCGPAVAKRAQVVLPWVRWSVCAGWDKAMHRLETATHLQAAQ